MKEGSLFVCHVEISQIMPTLSYHTFGIVGKPLMRMGASHNVFTYGGGVIEY